MATRRESTVHLDRPVGARKASQSRRLKASARSVAPELDVLLRHRLLRQPGGFEGLGDGRHSERDAHQLGRRGGSPGAQTGASTCDPASRADPLEVAGTPALDRCQRLGGTPARSEVERPHGCVSRKSLRVAKRHDGTVGVGSSEIDLHGGIDKAAGDCGANRFLIRGPSAKVIVERDERSRGSPPTSPTPTAWRPRGPRPRARRCETGRTSPGATPRAARWTPPCSRRSLRHAHEGARAQR